MNRGSVFISLTASGNDIMRNKYQYDAVDNILGISNTANPQSLFEKNRNRAKLGGASSHSYQYDELNRLIHATGKAKNASYDMAMTFNSMSMPLTKVQAVDSTTTAQSYHNIYRYEDSNHPSAPTQIGHEHYEYDANGNPTMVVNDSLNTTRELYWDEDNRLMVLSDNGKTSRYTYNHAGERIVKSHGDMEGVYINGAPQGITFHETDEFTLYPASIISVNKNRFTKHYFIGDKRIASRIGSGKFNNVYGRNGSYVTAGQQDYAERMNQIETQREDYYRELGIAPGVPTMKGAYGDPENTGVGYNTIIRELGDHSVPEAWAQYAKKNDNADTAPGAPIAWDDPVSPEEPEAGYGFVADDSAEPEETFFYHSDHLGSTSYITDDKGNITQYDAYLPYGELLVDEHSSSEDMPYKFNGKELDEETGLYYYGARYMQPVASIWYGVDNLFEENPSVSPYVYCEDNPVRLKDPDGNIPIETIWDAANVLYDFGAATVEHIKGNHTIAKEHWADLGADVAATFIPYVPAGITKVAKVAKIADKTAKATSNAAKTSVKAKTYQTYTKVHPKTGKVYVGRTSGTKSPRKNVEARDRNHHMNKYGFGPAKLDKTSNSYDAIRGREQLQIEKYGGAQSVGGTSGNRINGISPKNKTGTNT